MYLRKIIEIINCWDPMDLILCDNLKDEYISEANKINEICKTQSISIDILAKEIHEIFIDAFGESVFLKNIDDCKLIAQKILD